MLVIKCMSHVIADAISATQNSGLVQISIEGGAGGLLENGGPLMGAGKHYITINLSLFSSKIILTTSWR